MRLRIKRGVLAAIRPVVLSLFSIIPPRWAFTILVLTHAYSIPGRRFLTRLFVPIAIRQTKKDPNARFSTALTARFPAAACQLLYQLKAFEEGAEILLASGLPLESEDLSLLLYWFFFELGDFSKARDAVSIWEGPGGISSHPVLAHRKGLAELVLGNEAEAIPHLEFAAARMPHLM